MLKVIIFDFDGVLVNTYEKKLSICLELSPNLTSDEFKYHLIRDEIELDILF